MIGLSVAIGRFIEALFWAILRVAGGIAAVAIVSALGLACAWTVGRKLWRTRASARLGRR
ncbi:hypothetical protein [uncultured Sphingomonas sp.]|uniref:hypothetical protein n=1 Tax=uncultured Sphingomonas sp. TaxID=158754 RepID=UPI0035CAC5F1